MHLHSDISALFIAVSFLLNISIVLAEEKKPKTDPPCTVHSPNSGSFFDLTPISIQAPKTSSKQQKDGPITSWQAKGYDYSTNFTINFCAPVIEEVKNVVGVDKEHWGNVSAYYKHDNKIYSIGQLSTVPLFRGRKLVLNYTDGSPCNSDSSASSIYPRKDDPKKKDPKEKKPVDEDEDEDDEGDDDRQDHDDDNDDKSHKDKAPVHEIRRKSTLISLLCDRDPLAPKASVAFIGASPDECAYFFEVRTSAACGGANDREQTLGPGGVFGVIALIACLVYLVGGCVYQRTVLHARGWRQLPNYSMWAGIGGFLYDIFIILTSSCTRFLPRRKGYLGLPVGPATNNRGRRGRTADDENRLIDQLDEEWDD